MHPMVLASLGSALVGLAAIVSHLPNWQAATEPSVVASVLALVGASLLGIYAPKPGKP